MKDTGIVSQEMLQLGLVLLTVAAATAYLAKRWWKARPSSGSDGACQGCNACPKGHCPTAESRSPNSTP